MPSRLFHRNFWATFMIDTIGIELRHHMNVDHLMWSTDYPHTGTDWPNNRVTIARLFRGVPAGRGEEDAARQLQGALPPRPHPGPPAGVSGPPAVGTRWARLTVSGEVAVAGLLDRRLQPGADRPTWAVERRASSEADGGISGSSVDDDDRGRLGVAPESFCNATALGLVQVFLIRRRLGIGGRRRTTLDQRHPVLLRDHLHGSRALQAGGRGVAEVDRPFLVDPFVDLRLGREAPASRPEKMHVAIAPAALLRIMYRRTRP